MALASLLLAATLGSASGHCYLVTNERIVVVPSCDFSPDAVGELMKSEPPPRETARGPSATLPYRGLVPGMAQRYGAFAPGSRSGERW